MEIYNTLVVNVLLFIMRMILLLINYYNIKCSYNDIAVFGIIKSFTCQKKKKK